MADLVQECVAKNSVKPASNVAVRFEPAARFSSAQIGFLDKVLGVGSIAGKSHRVAQQFIEVLQSDGLEARLDSALTRLF